MIRSSKWFIVDACLKVIWESLFAVVSFVIIFNMSVKAAILLYGLLVLVLAPTINIARWYFTVLQLNEETIHFRKGILFKQHITLPLEKVTNITMQQSALQRIVQCSELTIDTGAQSDDISQIKLLLPESKALQLKEQLNSVEEKQERYDYIFRLDKGALSKLGLLRNSIIPMVTLALSFYFFVDEIASWFSYDWNATVQRAGNYLLANGLYGILLFVLLYVSSKLVIFVQTWIKYANFQIKEENDVFTIEHGYFSKKVYTVSKAHLYGIKRKQNILFQLLGLYELHTCVVGQSQNETKERILLPITTEKQMNQFLDTYLPQYAFRDVQFSVEPKHRLRFLVIPFIIALLITVVFSSIHSLFLLLFVSFPFLLFHFFLEGKETAFGCTPKLLWVRRGGFVRTEYCVARWSLQSYSEKQSYFQRRTNTSTYRLQFLSNGATLRHVSKDIWNQL